MIKKSRIVEGLFLYCLIYLCTFDYWDNTFGMLFKYFFFGIIFYGLLGFYGKLFVANGRITTYTKNTVLSYMFCIVLFLIQVFRVENESQRNLAFYQYVFYLIMIPGIQYLVDHSEIKRITRVLKITGIILSICAIYEVASGLYLIESSYLGIMYNGSRVIRAMVFSGSFLTFGTVMAVISIVSFYDFYVEKGIFNLFCLIINVIGLIMSSSRGPLVSFIVGSVFVYVYIGGKTNAIKLVKIAFTALLMGLLLVTLGTALSKTNSTIAFYWDRFQSIFDWTESSASNTSRISCWVYSIEVFQEKFNWILGIGPAATGARARANWGGFVTESGILKRFLELGSIIAIVYYTFFFFTVSSGVRKARKSNNTYMALSLGILVCILIEDTILQVTEELSITFLLWSFICILYKKADKNYR